MISIVGLNKAAVLAALYNAARPQGMGFLQYDPAPMTVAEAEQIISSQTYFDYLKGRVMKVDLKGEDLEEWLFDRDNGSGAAQAAINSLLRDTPEVNSPEIQAFHETGKATAAEIARKDLSTESTFDARTGTHRLGLADVADHLRPAIDRAVGEDSQETQRNP